MTAKKIILLALGMLWAAVPVRGLELGPHPRLYISNNGPGKVLSVEKLRLRVRSPEYAAVWKRIQASNSAADVALVCLLTGDTTRIDLVRKALGAARVNRYEALVDRCLAYDWAYGALTGRERKEFAAGLVASAKALADRYTIPTAYHNYCRGRHLGQGMTTLAVWGEDPGAQELYPTVEREMKELLEILGDGYADNDMEGRAGYGGGWPEGYDYDRHGSFYALQILLAWRSAGLGDLISRSSYWRDKIHWLFYGTGPGGRFILPYEDNDFPMILRQDREMMTFLAGEFGYGHARYWLDTFADTLACRPYWDLLFSDPSVVSLPPGDLPTSRLVPGLGLALMRSSWRGDATFVHFHCGPWYTYHQHAAQGSFTVFRNQPLVIEPGVYDGEVHEHYVNWRIRTISHNCITVLDSAERFLGPRDVPEPANDGGQVIQNWTLKPATVDEWRAQGKMRQTGRITTFVTDPSHDFAVGEAAGAYNPDKVQRWCRQMLFIKPDWLVICDLVEAGSADFPKTLIVHTSDEIKAENGVARTPASGKPSLTVFSLLPQGAALKVAGGPGKAFEYGGHNWESSPAYNDQYGVGWRLEVEAPSGKATAFLTVLCIADPDQAGPAAPEVKLLESSPESVALTLGGKAYRVELDPTARSLYKLSGPGIAYAVSGAVRNDGMPVEGARINLEGAEKRETVTDHHGRYSFTGLQPGQYRIVLQDSGKSNSVQLIDHSLPEVDFE